MNATSRAPVALTKAALRAAEALGLGHSELARILGVSRSSISRLASNARRIDPATKEGELALLLVRLCRSLDALVAGDRELRLAWLCSSNRLLNARPVDLIASVAGLVTTVAHVEAALARA